jgi:RimJ/RimL family protein N-acetyltransferase
MIGNRDFWDDGYGTDALSTLVDHVFRTTNVERVHLKTLAHNVRAQKSFRKCGFAECGHLSRDGYDFMLMEQFRKDWEERQEKAAE